MPLTLNTNADAMRQHLLGGSPGGPPVLLNHPTQSAAPIDGWKSIFFGLPFLLAGIGIGCAVLNIVHGRKNAPNWLIALIGSFFFLAGAFFMVHGFRGLARKAAYNRQAAALAGLPWLVDYHWQREGFPFSAFHAMVSRFLAALAWYAFLIPFFWVGLNQRGVARVFVVFASLFALIGLVF